MFIGGWEYIKDMNAYILPMLTFTYFSGNPIIANDLINECCNSPGAPYQFTVTGLSAVFTVIQINNACSANGKVTYNSSTQIFTYQP